MITVSLKLLATYRAKLPEGTAGNTVKVELADGCTVAELLARFDLPADQSSVVLVNGFGVSGDASLNEGDEVCVYSAIAGG